MRTAHLGSHQGMRWAPESRPGRWTLALAGMSVVGLLLTGVGFAAGVLESASSFSDNWLLAGWGAAVLASGAASVAMGAIAIIRRHDRSLTVLLATCAAVLVTAVLLNEVVQGV